MQADVLILCSIHSAGRSRFNETAIIGHSIIEPEAAGEVIAVKAVSGYEEKFYALGTPIHRVEAVVVTKQPRPADAKEPEEAEAGEDA